MEHRLPSARRSRRALGAPARPAGDAGEVTSRFAPPSRSRAMSTRGTSVPTGDCDFLVGGGLGEGLAGEGSGLAGGGVEAVGVAPGVEGGLAVAEAVVGVAEEEV